MSKPKITVVDYDAIETHDPTAGYYHWEFPEIVDSYGLVHNVLHFAYNIQTLIRKNGMNYDILRDSDGKCTLHFAVRINDLNIRLEDWKGWYITGFCDRKLTEEETSALNKFLKKLYIR